MKVCIIGDSLTSLALAKALVNREIFVDIFYKKKIVNIDKSRTIGISKSNIVFFNKNIANISKILWQIKKIKIFSENPYKNEIINFEDNGKNLFSILKNHNLIYQLRSDLKKNKFFKFKNNLNYRDLDKLNYNLVVICESKNEVSRKIFSKGFKKLYESVAFTTIIDHAKLLENHTAYQIFTSKGPIAFLPISSEKTSIVYSIKKSNLIDEEGIKKLILKLNPIYKIKKINKISKVDLNSFNLRKYYKGNILAFGDLLHKIHPLAGQGFNMSLRDIRELIKIIDNKIELGLPLDKSVCVEFQNKTRSKNFIFSEGIDFIYEFFNYETNFKRNFVDTIVKLVGKNKSVNKYLKKIADQGLHV